MKHLLELIEDLEARDIALVSLNEQIDTTSANGRLILRLLASLAAFSVIWTPPACPELAVAAA